MIRNYLKIAYRNLLRNKGFSVINITGLAIGMAAAMLILFWIQDEVSFDQFHKNKDRIYQVWNRATEDEKTSCWSSVSAPVAPAIQKDLPEVERVVRVIGSNTLLTAGEKKIQQSGYLVDTGFLETFSFPLIQGNLSSALNNKYSVVLTERTAKRLFGEEDPMGKSVKIGDKDQFTVTGILKDPPANSVFQFEYLLPYSYLTYGKGQDLGWADNSTPTFVLLKPNVNFALVDAKMKVLRQQYDEGSKKLNWELFLYPLSR
jgi:putative ABC transport system permease protein